MDVRNLSSRQAARRGALLALPLLPILVIVSLYGGPGLGLAAYVIAGSLLIAALILSRFHRRFWFWLTLAVLAAAHAFLIVRVPWQWTNRLTAPEIWPLGFGDLLFDVGCFKLVAWLVGERAKK